jgi:hypothetical protein
VSGGEGQIPADCTGRLFAIQAETLTPPLAVEPVAESAVEAVAPNQFSTICLLPLAPRFNVTCAGFCASLFRV